jgi:hypothetical protein
MEDMIVSVRLEMLTTTIIMAKFLRNLCGMELVVGLTADAVISMPLHGSTSNCHNPQLMTLR